MIAESCPFLFFLDWVSLCQLFEVIVTPRIQFTSLCYYKNIFLAALYLVDWDAFERLYNIWDVYRWSLFLYMLP